MLNIKWIKIDQKYEKGVRSNAIILLKQIEETFLSTHKLQQLRLRNIPRLSSRVPVLIMNHDL